VNHLAGREVVLIAFIQAHIYLGADGREGVCKSLV
jgi:hypothetical protein